jgi:hypothetical protein
MVAFCTLTMMAALFGTAAAQMVQIDSTSMTLVEKNTVTFPTVGGFEFEMDTFTWTSEDGNVVVGDMGMDMETSPMYGDVGDAGYGTYGSYGSYGSIMTGSYGETNEMMEYVPYSVTLSTESTISVDGSVSPLTASILTLSTGNARCRSAAELRVNMDLIMEIDSDLSGSHVSRWDRQRVR